VSDRYLDFANGPVGAAVTRRLGLPRPAALRRHRPGDPLLPGPAVLLRDAGEIGDRLLRVLTGADVSLAPSESGGEPARAAGVVVDATGVRDVAGLAAVRSALQPLLRGLGPGGRVVVTARPADESTEPVVAASRAALEGLVRSLAKELRAGATANLVLVSEGAEDAVESTLRFLLSGRSAFVDGQVLRVGPADVTAPPSWERPLEGRVAVVTGAARGIGAAIASVLARDGASVVCADLAASGDRLATVANDVRGTALQVDVTDPAAAERIADQARGRHGRLDVLVHNAGITRDKLLANMTDQHWDSVLAVNLEAQLRTTSWLLDNDALGVGSRVVSAASTSGIAGNRGQTNYAASKAGVIGMVRALAPLLAQMGGTANAVAPGFIETDMTASMPLGTREVARRISSLQQGGRPVDVAETVAWLAQEATAGVNGQVVRVCGQSLVGA
jgi:3-oxoacyl-[acyl-carrier protein] reductase